MLDLQTIIEQSNKIIQESKSILDLFKLFCEEGLLGDNSGVFHAEEGCLYSLLTPDKKEMAIRGATETVLDATNSIFQIVGGIESESQLIFNIDEEKAFAKRIADASKQLKKSRSVIKKQRDVIKKNSQGSVIDSASNYAVILTEFEDRLDDTARALADLSRSLRKGNSRLFDQIKSDLVAFPQLSEVQFSAVFPSEIQKGNNLLFSIYMYEEAFRSVVDEALSDVADTKEHKSGYFDVEDKTRVKIILNSPDLTETEIESSQWRGKYLRFDFSLSIPDGFLKKQILFIASIYFNDFLTTKLKFVISVDDAKETKPQISRKDILSAFISYASQDRSRVASVIQGMKKARPDLDVFFDVENLRSGEKWEDVLRKEIDERDVLYLFWSHFARESEWVDMEWRYALERKGIDFIEPVPIETPDNCPPPKELSAKHFNDRELLYYQNYCSNDFKGE